MIEAVKGFWRGLVGATQKDKNYLPVSGRRFCTIGQQYGNDPTYITCIELLAKAMSNVKYRVYGGDNAERDFAQFRKVFDVKANQWQNTSEFLRLMERDRLQYGNAYAYIKWGKGDTLDSLIPLSPNYMRVYINNSIDILDSEIIYEYSDGTNTFTFLPEELIHVRAFSQDGIKGIPASEVLKALLNKAGLASSYSDEILNNGYGGVMVLEYTSDLNKTKAIELTNQIKEILKHQGNRMLALPPGIKASILGPTSVDPSFINLTENVSKDIAGFFGIPLFLLNKEAGNGTAGMTTAQASAFYNQVLEPAVTQYAAEFSSKLLTSRQIQQGVRFDNADMSGFGVLDANERTDNYVKLAAGGILTVNEVRKELGYAPYQDEFDSGNKLYRNGAFTSGDNGDSTGNKEEDITKTDNTVKDH